MEEKDTEKKEPEKQKTAPKLPLMIGGGVLIIAVLLGGGFLAMKSFMAPTQAAESETGELVDDNTEGALEATGIYYEAFDAFITVLKPSEDYRFTYLKFVPKLELSDQKTMMEILAKMPSIEAKINAVMTDLDWNTVKSERGRERHAEKLAEKLNEILESGEIVKIYFTTFVAQ